MDAAEMAAIYAAAFPEARAWSAAEITDLLTSDTIAAVTRPEGFALLQALPEEAELLTIAVRPEAQGRGIGAAVLADVMTQAAQRGARVLFLEVDTLNHAARALYAKAGFAQIGHRKSYYHHRDGTRSDAILLSRVLDGGKTGSLADS